MRSIQTNPMIFMSDRLSVAFSFSRKGALTHHLIKQAVVALPLVGHVRSPRGIAAPCGSRWTRLHFCQTASLVHAVGAGVSVLEAPVHGVVYCHPIPPSACVNSAQNKSFGYVPQLDTDAGVERIIPPLRVVRRISRCTERKQECPVSGHPFQKGQGDLWRFIIWRPK